MKQPGCACHHHGNRVARTQTNISAMYVTYIKVQGFIC